MAKKKKSSSAKSAFSLKEFLILHVEKIVFGIVALLSLSLASFGFMAKSYPSSKTPDGLREQATLVSRSIKENHWEQIKESQPPIKTDYVVKALDGRRKISPEQTLIFPPVDNSLNRRGDPVLNAPLNLEVIYYSGPVAGTLRPKAEDPVTALDDAKKPEEKAPKQPNRRPGGSSGAGSDGASGSGGEGSMAGFGGPGGMGGPGGLGGLSGAGGPAGTRFLSPGYDRGFQMGMRTFLEMPANTAPASQTATPPAKKIPYSIATSFIAVTALAPHQEMETSYKKEFADVRGYVEGRDTPNYVGFEVQRAEITDKNAYKELDESEWKPLPNAGTEEFKKFAKNMIGTCAEVQRPDWTEPNISMPIPPVLLNDYRKYASHSQIPKTTPEPKENEGEAVDAAGGFGAGGYGAGGYGAGGYGGDGGYGMGGMGGMGGSEGGYPGGGTMGGDGSYGGSGGSGGAGAGPGSGPGPGSGYGGGDGGYGGSDGGMGSGFMGGGTGFNSAQLPKRLPSTKYKLVRFYDFNVTPGKTYKYRVRLLMYDPNFPEYSAFQPKTETLKSDAVKRVQILLANEPKEAKVTSTSTTTTPKPLVKRPSKRETDWSLPSPAISAIKPPMVFAGFEAAQPKVEAVVVEFDKAKAVYVPLKYPVDAGVVLGATRREKGKEIVPEIIHPTGKSLKSLKDFKSTSMVTVINISNKTKLEVQLPTQKEKEPLMTGYEVVSFDPSTGQLIVSREFDDFTGFNMYSQPDKPAVGPLGGGLKVESSGIGGYESGGMGGESSGGPGGAPGGPGGGMSSGKGPGGKG